MSLHFSCSSWLLTERQTNGTDNWMSSIHLCTHSLIHSFSLSIWVWIYPILWFSLFQISSGLDSISSIQVIKHLHQLAHDGHRTIICVIHQPSSSLFQLFDDVYLLSNGYCIYNGSLEAMVDSFKQAGFNCPTAYYNRADYALEVASMQRGDNIDQLIDLAKVRGGDALVSSAVVTVTESLPENLMNGQRLDVVVVDNNNDNNRHLQHHDVNGETERMLTNGRNNRNIYAPISQSIDGDTTVAASRARQCDYLLEKMDYPVSTWRQIQVLAKRSAICTLRDFVSCMKYICPLFFSVIFNKSG